MRRALERRKAAGGWAAGDVGAAEDGADAVEIGRHDVAERALVIDRAF
jgi:hypothetical protein